MLAAGGVLPSAVGDKCAAGFICQPAVDSTIVNTVECVAGSSGLLAGQHEYGETCGLNTPGFYDNSGSVTACVGGTVCPRGSTQTVTCTQGTSSTAQSAEYYECVPCTGGSYCREGVAASTPSTEKSVTTADFYRLLGYRGTYFSPIGRKQNASTKLIEDIAFGKFKDDSQGVSGAHNQTCPDGTTPLGTGSHSAISCLACADRTFCANTGTYAETSCTTQVCIRNLQNGQGCERG